MKKILVAILAAVMVLSMTACGAAPEEEAPAEQPTQAITSIEDGSATVAVELDEDETAKLIEAHTNSEGKTFVSVAVEADPGTLSPFGSGVGKVQHVIRNALFETCFCVLRDGSLGPVLATDYVQLDDVTYEIHLKDYIYDTAGNHLTAHDVVFSYLCGRDEWNSGNMSTIANVEAIDDYTVKLTMKSAQVGTFEKVMYEGWIFTQAAYEASPDQFITTPVGTSPYRLVSWETGSEIVIEKTGNYWETDDSKKQLIQMANVDIVTYKVISDPAQLIISLQSGEVDLIHKVDVSNLSLLENDYQIFSTLNNQVMNMFFNCSENSVCGDVRVRQAICYAIDAAGVLQAVCSGQGMVNKVFATPDCADAYDYWNEEGYYPYNMDTAAKLLEEAGYSTSNPLSITLMYETTDRNAPTAEIVQAYLAAVGINVNLLPCEGAAYSSYKLDSKAGWDIHIGSVGGFGPNCIHPWANALYASTNENNQRNVIGAVNPELVSLIDLCYASETHTEENMTKLNTYMTENALVCPLYQYMLYTATTDIFTTMNLRCGGREIAPQYCEYIWNN